jgi:hypothetical protein
MRWSCMRFTSQRMILFALGATAVSAVWLAAPLMSRAQVAEQPRMTLMGTLSEWKYPDSNLLGGATMSDGGNPLVPDVKCRAILATPDPIDKVIAFYSKKVKTPPAAGGADAQAAVKDADAKAVVTQDDSDGRPITLRVIVVTKADTTTTLVISRAREEKETHIAWSHYRRFDDVRIPRAR